MKNRELFGEVAVRLGFVKPKDVQVALKIQEAERSARKKHRLIGLIMLDRGILDNTQLIAVLKEIEAQQNHKPRVTSIGVNSHIQVERN